MSFRWIAPLCSQFDIEYIEKIVQVGVRVLRSVPWTIDGTDEFMDCLSKFGCMELMYAVENLAAGFDVDEEKLAEEVIKKVAPHGARFLECEHTFKHFREAQWFPELFDRRITGAYALEPKTMLERVKQKALHLIKTAPNLCPLDDSQRRELMKILATADAELG